MGSPTAEMASVDRKISIFAVAVMASNRTRIKGRNELDWTDAFYSRATKLCRWLLSYLIQIMIRKATLILFLCSLFLLGASEGARAQDILTFKVDPSGICCWGFTVKNRNTTQDPITKIEMTFPEIGTITFAGGEGPGAWGEAKYSDDERTITYELIGGNPIQPNQDVSGFYFCHSGFAENEINKPVKITWKTYSLDKLLTTTTQEFVCTDFQSLIKLDTVTVTSTKVNTDPVYNFTVFNRNKPLGAPGYDIGKMVFEITTVGGGNIRPSLVEAPAGWALDSVTPTRVYFSAFQPLETNKSLGGFKVGLRSNANTKSVQWVWRAFNTEGISIDRDTLRQVANNAENGLASNDQVTFSKQAGCLYNMSVANLHITNTQLPAKITGVRLVSKTPGVTFTAAPTKPAKWSASIKTGSKDTLTFGTDEANGIPSGLTYSDFAFSVDNPTGNEFTIEWQTLRNNAIVSSATSPLTCQSAAAQGDAATITKVDENCFFNIEVTNQHNNPPSAISAIGVSIPAGSGTLTANAAGLNWEITSSNSTSFLAKVPQGSPDVLAAGQKQNITFTMVPKDGSKPTTVTWATYETAGGAVTSTGTQAISCTPIKAQVCDSTSVRVTDQEKCWQEISVFNHRIENEAVNSITITPTGGWFVDSAQPSIGWQRTVGANGSSVTYTGTLDGGLATPLKLSVRFNAAKGTAPDFTATVRTLGANATLTCDTTIAFNCTPTVEIDRVEAKLQAQMKLSLAPNPATSETRLNYYLPQQGRVAIAVIDVLGNTQKTIFSGLQNEGNQQAQVSLGDLPNGSYYVRIETSYGTITKQLIINR